MPNLLSIIPMPYRILLLMAFALVLYGSGYVAGLCHEQAAWQASDAKREKADTDHLLAATQSARAKETALRNKLDAATTQRLQENADHETQLNAVRAAARAGAERLRCPGAALPADTEANNPGAASGPEPEAGRDGIVPATADDLFRIAGSIRQSVRERNALIDAYDAARATCNATSEPSQ